jgi:hypothetical protein
MDRNEASVKPGGEDGNRAASGVGHPLRARPDDLPSAPKASSCGHTVHL